MNCKNIWRVVKTIKTQRTYSAQISTSGPYFSLVLKSSGAAYSKDPQCVFIISSLVKVLLRPKSERKTYVYQMVKGE
jgi:hypothetical protein